MQQFYLHENFFNISPKEDLLKKYSKHMEELAFLNFIFFYKSREKTSSLNTYAKLGMNDSLSFICRVLFLLNKERSILRAYDRVSILCRNALLSRASINI